MAKDETVTDLTALAIADIPKPEDDGTDIGEDSGKYFCSECGTDITSDYKGKGRPPTKCKEHRKRTASNLSGNKSTGSTDVRKAADTLEDAYSMLAMFLAIPAPDAASALSESIEPQREKNIRYLSHDPKLVKAINRVGGTGGRFMFVFSQAMLLGPVAAIAAGEIRARMNANAEAQPGGTVSDESQGVFAGFGFDDSMDNV